MHHMLSCFDLKAGEDFESFQQAYAAFVGQMKQAGMILASGPIARRVPDTPMDTDAERGHAYFSILSFADRDQLDAAYAYIMEQREPARSAHHAVYGRVENPVFICWQDLSSPKD